MEILNFQLYHVTNKYFLIREVTPNFQLKYSFQIDFEKCVCPIKVIATFDLIKKAVMINNNNINLIKT